MLDVFEVAQVDEIASDHWLVGGRCLETVMIGDIVFSAVGRSYIWINEGDRIRGMLVQAQPDLDVYPFTIVAISTYGHQIDELGGGLTGNLTLKGVEGAALQETKYLVFL